MIEVGQHNTHTTPTSEACQMTNILKPMVEKQMSRSFKNFDLIEHTTQVVNGVMHKMKIKVSEDECLHLRVVENHSGGLTINDITPGKHMTDKL